MKRLSSFAVVVFLLLACTWTQPAAADRGESLMLDAGTMQLGGRALLHANTRMPEEGDDEYGFAIDLAPEFGVFVARGLELTAGLNFGFGFGDLYNKDVNLGLNLGMRFVFHMVPVVKPYVGGMLGFQMYIPEDDEFIGDQYRLLLSIPIGILIQLNQHVALNIGIGSKFQFDLGDDDGPIWVFQPLGYFGVEAFF